MLEGVAKLFKKPDPKELVRKWQATLRAEERKIERQIRGALCCFYFCVRACASLGRLVVCIVMSKAVSDDE
jgi:hypothetical protein